MRVVIVFFCLLVLTNCRSVIKEEIAKELLESKIYDSINTMEDALKALDILEEAQKNYTAEPFSLPPFACPPTGRSPTIPENARRLKPADIDLVCAVGDSIVTGAIATNIVPPFDKRSYSFCGGSPGASAGYDTLATSLLAFNPNLKGYATGSGNAGSANAALNVAVDGATSFDLEPQVTMLLSKLESNRGAWKHLSIFIGGNDLCNSCDDFNYYTAANYKANLEKTLLRIKQNIPRVFISLITPPEVTILNQLSGSGCYAFTECKCKANDQTKRLHPDFSKALHLIEADPIWNDKEDFYLTVQPFFEAIKLPTLANGSPDKSYFAIDCFHLSAKGHSASGMGLWNNLMEPRASKKRTWEASDKFSCPGPDQYIQ